MSESNQPVTALDTSQEMKALAETMVESIERGELSHAVSLVNQLNQVRDKTLYEEIGRLTRALHESIKNLNIESVGAGSEIEKATDKLTYVVEMTDKSANRTMDLVDEGIPLAAGLNERAATLGSQWQKFLNKELKPDEFRALTKDIQEFLTQSETHSRQIKDQFSEILLAQDFQDLTGQVIQKVADLVRDVEGQLVKLVVMAGTVDQITGIDHGDIEVEAVAEADEDAAIQAEGPQIDTSVDGVVASQDDVDDLLSSLGF